MRPAWQSPAIPPRQQPPPPSLSSSHFPPPSSSLLPTPSASSSSANGHGHHAHHSNSIFSSSHVTGDDKLQSASTALDRVMGLLDGFEVSRSLWLFDSDSAVEGGALELHCTTRPPLLSSKKGARQPEPRRLQDDARRKGSRRGGDSPSPCSSIRAHWRRVCKSSARVALRGAWLQRRDAARHGRRRDELVSPTWTRRALLP